MSLVLSRPRPPRGLVLLTSLLLAAGMLLAPPANAVERGPAPTRSSLDATAGPFSITSTSVSSFAARGFGGADIYYPSSTRETGLGGVAISPGYTASRSSMEWLARRIASHGFVVINIDTNGRYDQPASRGDQLLAALDYLTQRSTVRDRVDASRLAVVGHSMGGGGAFEAGKDRRTLDAVIGLTPYNNDKSWPEIASPTLVVGAEDDSVASTRSHAIPLYEGVPTTSGKAYVELRGASHFAPNSTNATIGRFTVAWLKRFLDSDTRYQQFLCPISRAESAISDHRSTCNW